MLYEVITNSCLRALTREVANLTKRHDVSKVRVKSSLQSAPSGILLARKSLAVPACKDRIRLIANAYPDVIRFAWEIGCLQNC